MGSSSSAELTEVAGFRLERELGRGRRAVVYEATQLNLGRRVALKLLPATGCEDFRALHWPEHPRVVSLYATGLWEQGRYVAMQLVRGPTLAELRETGRLDPARLLDLLADVASGLDAAHRAGMAHGAVAAHNVLVDADGHALLSDFGLAPGEATVPSDRADFQALVRDCFGDSIALPRRPSAPGELVQVARAALPAPPQAPRAGGTRNRRRLAVAAALAAGAAVAATLATVPDRGDEVPVPPPQRGAQPLGSTLASGDVSSVDCSGRAPSGASQACTVVQTRLPGRELVPPAAGAVRRWTVRGARGELALQVIRARGDRWVSVGRSRYAAVADEGVHVLPANLAVREGDLIGVELAPGAAIGVRRGVPGARTARWLGRLFLVPRPIELGPGTGFDHELLLRVEYRRGAAPVVPGRLSGASARGAPRGRELGSRTVEVQGHPRRVTAVELADGVAVDLFAGDRRLARIPVSDADPAGRLLSLSTFDLAHSVLRWRNPDGRIVQYEYDVGTRTLRPRG